MARKQKSSYEEPARKRGNHQRAQKDIRNCIRGVELKVEIHVRTKGSSGAVVKEGK